MKQSTERNEVKLAKQMRDELALQAHLFTLDMKSEWQKLEKQFSQLQSSAKPALEKSVEKLSAELQASYRKFREALKKSA